MGTPLDAKTILSQGRDNSVVFEQEVRRIAREIFPTAGGFGPVTLNGRERDGVLNDGENIYIFEATRNTKKLKAEGDLDKSCDLKKELQRSFPDSNFKIWFITEKDPLPDQTAAAVAARRKAKCPVVAMSYATFCQKLIDAPSYLAARDNYNFGSVRNPDPKQPNIPVDERQFIPLGLVALDSKLTTSPDEMCSQLSETGGICNLLGDFGAGKSMTMRHIYFKLRDNFRKGVSTKFPVHINLRDHVGQDNTSSALFDHGTRTGFAQPERLVRAWRAGFIHLLLDGFDEISSSRFRSDAAGLRAVRRKAMSLVRHFIEEHPSDQAGLLLSGRENYFGGSKERWAALGLDNVSFHEYSLNEFTTEQVQDYLRRIGLSDQEIPDWLPSRPLLVGYLATRQIIGKSNLVDLPRGEGWDYILDRISAREGSQIDDLGGQRTEVRAFVDRLATKARVTTTGRGPIMASEMMELFKQIFPGTPDDAARQLLLRMAGLTAPTLDATAMVSVSPDQEDAREFTDSDLVDAARAGDVARFVRHSFDDNLNALFCDPNMTTYMGDVGVEVAAYQLKDVSFGQLRAALQSAGTRLDAPYLALDIFNIIQATGAP